MTISQASIDEVREVSEARAARERNAEERERIAEYQEAAALLKSKALEIAYLVSLYSASEVPLAVREKVAEFRELDDLAMDLYARMKGY